jgi:hypothetical protein
MDTVRQYDIQIVQDGIASREQYLGDEEPWVVLKLLSEIAANLNASVVVRVDGEFVADWKDYMPSLSVLLEVDSVALGRLLRGVGRASAAGERIRKRSEKTMYLYPVGVE